MRGQPTVAGDHYTLTWAVGLNVIFVTAHREGPPPSAHSGELMQTLLRNGSKMCLVRGDVF